ncbi:MAG: nuclear transport factor 2 family protein [Bacilli bacterium]|nr:nuclear transport factor 2 family protein [Bacilli bacterium]
MSDEEIIKKLYIELSEASVNKDIDKLNSILADDYILVHMTGMNQSKNDYIESVLSGELKYYESKHESIDVIINNDKAKVIGKTKTLASPFGSSKSWWNLKQEIELEKINDKWIIKKSIASTY